MHRRIDGHLVVGGSSHDFDGARLDLLALAARDDRLRIRVSSTFEEVADGSGVAPPTFLLSYSCNLAPSAQALARIAAFLAGGGRWVALHATNALIRWLPEGVVCEDLDNPFLALIGSAFQAHPPIGPFEVRAVHDHPLVAGVAPFMVTDELYLGAMAADVDVLLATDFLGQAPGFLRCDWTGDDPVRPLMTLRRVGEGAVLHLALGHRRGHYDAPHRAPYLSAVERGAWDSEAFHLLLARALAWAARTDRELEAA
ncbi:MAG: ThuA domain-containing protein [Thermaurantiacus sp.]